MAAAWNVDRRPTAGISTNPAASAPAMAPSVFAVYTRAASSRPVGAAPASTASASGNVAPSASVIGSSRIAIATACAAITCVNTTAGSATCAATMSGRRVAANHAAPLAATADMTSIAPSQIAGCAVRRASRVPAAEPSASPLMNAAAIVANA